MWGGFFERLKGVMKRSLPKSIGRCLVTFEEIEEALIDVEASLNHRPLLYQGGEFEEPIIAPNILLRGRLLSIVEEDLELIGYKAEVSTRIKLLQRSKHQLKKRFMNEYIHALVYIPTADSGKIFKETQAKAGHLPRDIF